MSTPLVSFVLVVDEDKHSARLARTIASLLSQTEAFWELLIHGGVATSPAEPSAPDPRVRFVGSAQDVLSVAEGELIGWLDAGGELVPEAVGWCAAALEDDTDILYTDEEFPAAPGAQSRVHRRPAWSPQRLRGHDWTGRLTLFRTDLVRRLGGLRTEAGAAAEHDLALRAGEVARGIVHLGEVAHRTTDEPAPVSPTEAESEQTWDLRVRVVAEHLSRQGLATTASRGPRPGLVALHRPSVDDLTVTAIIATSGGRGLAWGRHRRHVVEAVRSLVTHGGHDRLEILVVHPPEITDRVLGELRDIAGDRLHLEPHVGYQMPSMVNRGLLASSSDAVLILDEHIEVLGPDLVARLVGPLLEPDIGMTGPRMLGTDGSPLNLGFAWYGLKAVPVVPGLGDQLDRGPAADWTAWDVDRECSIVSARCCALLRENLTSVGCLSESLPSLFEVDLSLKVAHLGLSSLLVPAPAVYDLAPPSARAAPGELEVLQWRARWRGPACDAYVPAYGRRSLHDHQTRLQRRLAPYSASNLKG